MRREDATEFQALLDRTCSLLSRGSYVPDPDNCALFFRALVRYDLADVRRGFEAHIADPQRGRFVPTPADILAQITGDAINDGRPGAEEAWAIVLRGADEAATIVWTAEMAEAWGIAKSVMDMGDEVGARMAFRETYTRLVDEAREQRLPAAWSATLGYDEARRAAAIQEAVDKGRLQRADVEHMLPALPAPEDVELLEGPKADPAAQASARAGRLHRRDAALAKLAEMSAGDRDALGWARDLKAKEAAGQPLTEAQRKAWREALDGAFANAGDELLQFRPIPVEALPPGMRGRA